MTVSILPITEARNNFLTLVKEAHDTFSHFVITYRGKPEAVILAFEEFEGWLETLEIAQSPKWRKAVKQARKEDKAGKYLTLEQVVRPYHITSATCQRSIASRRSNYKKKGKPH